MNSRAVFLSRMTLSIKFRLLKPLALIPYQKHLTQIQWHILLFIYLYIHTTALSLPFLIPVPTSWSVSRDIFGAMNLFFFNTMYILHCY